jgi:ELWxxDGT repeat protein
VTDANPGAFNPTDLVDLNGTVYFEANGGAHGAQLWKYDGSTASEVADINGNNGSSPANLTPFDNVLLFTANDGTHGNELWRSDGTAAGTQQILDINPGPGSSDPSNLTVVGP